MKIRELLTILNAKAEKYDVGYMLQCNYQWSRPMKRVYTKTLLLKFSKGKLVSKEKLRRDIDTIPALLREINKYEK